MKRKVFLEVEIVNDEEFQKMDIHNIEQWVLNKLGEDTPEKAQIYVRPFESATALAARLVDYDAALEESVEDVFALSPAQIGEDKPTLCSLLIRKLRHPNANFDKETDNNE